MVGEVLVSSSFLDSRRALGTVGVEVFFTKLKLLFLAGADFGVLRRIAGTDFGVPNTAFLWNPKRGFLADDPNILDEAPNLDADPKRRFPKNFGFDRLPGVLLTPPPISFR